MKRTIGYLKTTAVYANSQQVVDKVHMILLTFTLSTFSDKDFVFREANTKGKNMFLSCQK